MKRVAQSPAAPVAADPATIESIDNKPDGGDSKPVSRAAAIWSRLELHLDRQTMEASRIAGPVGVEFHREALYVMAVLTDEIFLHLDWEGRDYWLAHLFEERFFHSHFSGDGFFARIDALLARDDNPAAETATVYLMALALGFRGKYWAPEHEPALQSYRNRLFFFIARRDPNIAESVKRLYPDAYRHTIQQGAPRSLPNPRRWILVLGALVIVWLVVAQSLWSNLTADLNHKVCCLTPGCNESCPK